MNFIETRGNDGIKDKEVTFSYAILNPSASFRGLYIPKNLPNIDKKDIEDYTNSSYKQLAYEILKKFQIDVNDEDIKIALDLYDNFDYINDPCPIVKLQSDLFVQEQFRGPTRAFKDMALQPFGSILSSIAKKQNQDYLILAATSGDTGPAALKTFENKDNIKVVCMYPNGGTSDVQRLQMITQEGNNLKVIGINGNFDDAQNALKQLLGSKSFKDELNNYNIKVSAANSVNFGRIIFQVIFHIYSYIDLLKKGEIKYPQKINIIVPSGNFGNALGGYYAKKMGIPINKILIASNENDILCEFINSGIYDISNKKLIKTTSPAMDILKSSNIERILFDMFGHIRTKELFDNLEKNHRFILTSNELKILQKEFSAISCDKEFGLKTIKRYLDDGYMMDPHTATCIKAYENLKKDNFKCVMYSTAQWTKFSPTVLNAIKEDTIQYKDEDALNEISKNYNQQIPKMIQDIFKKDILHKDIIDKNDIENSIVEFIKSTTNLT
jgi:threonine synthase